MAPILASSLVAVLCLLTAASALPSERPLIFKRDRFGLPVRSLKHPALDRLSNQRERLFAKYERHEKNIQANWAAGLVVANGKEKRSLETEQLQKRQSNGVYAVPLTDQYTTFDVGWLHNISVGTQNLGPFTVLPDTGSSDTWLAAPGSTNFTSSQTFDPSASPSFRKTGDNVTLGYGKGAFKGDVGLDSITIAGLTVNNATVETGLAVAGSFGSFNFSGVVGYAFSSISMARRPTLISSIISAGLIAKPQFSIYLNRGFASVKDVPSPYLPYPAEVGGGVLTLGGADSSRYQGTPETFTLRNKQHWTINMSGMVIDGKAIPNTSAPAAIDSGTSLIAVPDNVATAILKAFGRSAAVEPSTQAIYAACRDIPQSLAFTFDGSSTTFEIAPEDFLIRITGAEAGLSRLDPLYGENICLTSIQTGTTTAELNPTTGQADLPLVILGDAFMKNWYTTFDFGGPENDTSATASVSFAKAIPTSSKSLQQSITDRLSGNSSAGTSGGNGSTSSATSLTALTSTAVVAVFGLAVGVIALL